MSEPPRKMLSAMIMCAVAGPHVPTIPVTTKYFDTDDRISDGWQLFGSSSVSGGSWITDYSGSQSVLEKVYGGPFANAKLEIRMKASGDGVRKNERVVSIFDSLNPNTKGVRVRIKQVDDSFPIGHTTREIVSNGVVIWTETYSTSTGQLTEGYVRITKTGTSYLVEMPGMSHSFTNVENVDTYHVFIEGQNSFPCGVDELDYAN